MRNGYNFYHFLTEAMPQLAVISEVESGAPIYVHLPVLDHLKGFVPAFVQAIYPQLAHRVEITDTPTRYPKVRLVYNHRHYLYQSGDPQVAQAVAHLPEDDPWHRVGSDRLTRKFLLKSTYDTGQRLLREHALARLVPATVDAQPERIWIGRDPSREDFKQRPNSGESELLEALAGRGFDVIYMEKLSPLEQVAAINGAEMIVAPHGAAFSHMLFARPTATVIEIGTPQTQLHRWGDFLGNAHVSRCRYSTVFADVEGAEEMGVPSIMDGHRGIHFGAAAQSAVLDHIDRFGSDSQAAHESIESLAEAP
nr:glycosyltransferase family 61 protein [Paracoccus sp. Z118]